MLPPGFLGTVLFDFVKKRTKDPRHICRNYLLCSVLFFLAFGMTAASLMLITGPMEKGGRFLLLSAAAMLLIGSLYGLITWLIWFRKEP